MTPKEKADSLVKSFIPYCMERMDTRFNRKYYAKQCALIAVEAIKDFIIMDDVHNRDCHMSNTHWPQYWKEVITEIENL